MRAFVTALLREAQVVVAAGIGDPGEAKAATWSNVQNREAPKRTDGINDPSHNGYSARVAQWPRRDRPNANRATVTTEMRGGRAILVTQFGFSCVRGGQRILFHFNGALARLLHLPRLNRVEFNIRLKLGRNVSLGVDGVHRAFINASHAIYALLRMNHQLTLQLIKAGDRANHHAIGELAPYTFISNDMRHNIPRSALLVYARMLTDAADLPMVFVKMDGNSRSRAQCKFGLGAAGLVGGFCDAAGEGSPVAELLEVAGVCC